DEDVILLGEHLLVADGALDVLLEVAQVAGPTEPGVVRTKGHFGLRLASRALHGDGDSLRESPDAPVRAGAARPCSDGRPGARALRRARPPISEVELREPDRVSAWPLPPEMTARISISSSSSTISPSVSSSSRRMTTARVGRTFRSERRRPTDRRPATSTVRRWGCRWTRMRVWSGSTAPTSPQELFTKGLTVLTVRVTVSSNAVRPQSGAPYRGREEGKDRREVSRRAA